MPTEASGRIHRQALSGAEGPRAPGQADADVTRWPAEFQDGNQSLTRRDRRRKGREQRIRAMEGGHAQAGDRGEGNDG